MNNVKDEMRSYMDKYFEEKLNALKNEYETRIRRTNKKKHTPGNGIVERYLNPVLTADHVPYFWKYDLNPATNPLLLERFGINAVFNAGAIRFNDKYLLVA